MMKQKDIQFSPKLIGDLLDIIHNAIIVIDSLNHIIFANKRTATMFKATRDTLHGLSITQLFMPDDLDIMVPNILSIIREEGEFDSEIMLQRPDGSTFLGLIAGTCFHWDNKKKGMAFTIHDISDVKAIEHALRHSEHSAFLGRLVDDISHQLRNPVTVIGGFARRLSTECSNPMAAKAIMKETSHLENLLDSLNNFIRLPRPNPSCIRMDTLMDAMEKRLGDMVRVLGCKWVSEYEPDIAGQIILVDQSLLLEALETIIINACESYDRSDREKNVIFQVKYSDDPTMYYMIKVIDHGVGIPDEKFRQVFAHFYSNKTKHIGMGLTFAQRILEEQMGKINIDSTIGRGTTVTCHLIKERRRAIRTTKREC